MKQLNLNAHQKPRGSPVKRTLAAMGTGLMLTFCTPMADGIVQTAHAQQVKEARGPVYNAQTNPFGMDDAMRRLVSRFNSGTAREKVEHLFSTLRRGGSEGVTVSNMAGQPPRTGAETLARGGDCTDLANLVIPLLRGMGVPGGALIVHFNGDPPELLHMVPYAQLGEQRRIVDLQTSRLGDIAGGAHTVVATLTYDQAAAMYHAEWGDYLRDSGRNQDAITAFQRSLAIFEADAHVHWRLAVIYQQLGQMAESQRHRTRARELDPQRFGGAASRGSYNEELRAGYEAFEQQRWGDCAGHFRNALDSGESLRADERRMLEQHIEACERNERVSGQ